MNRIEMTKAMPAGASVIRGANKDRKISSSSTMMKMNERHCTWLPVLLDWAWLATLVAIRPADVEGDAGVGRIPVGLVQSAFQVVDDRLLRRRCRSGWRWS